MADATSSDFVVFGQSDMTAGTYTSPNFPYDGQATVGFQILSSNWSSVTVAVGIHCQQSFDGTSWADGVAFTVESGIPVTTFSMRAGDNLGARYVRVMLTIDGDINLGMTAGAV